MNSFQPMRVLSDAQIGQIHGTAEEILEDTGVCVQHEDLLRRARIAGARVDEANGRVRLPKALLKELIGQAPARYIVRNVLGGEYEIEVQKSVRQRSSHLWLF